MPTLQLELGCAVNHLEGELDLTVSGGRFVSSDPSSDPPLIRRLRVKNDDEERSRVVTRNDETGVSAADLRSAAEHLEVFEPHGPSMLRWAREVSRPSPWPWKLSSRRKHPGLYLNPLTIADEAERHRLVGDGARPGPAMVTWLVAALFVSIFSLVQVGCDEVPPNGLQLFAIYAGFASNAGPACARGIDTTSYCIHVMEAAGFPFRLLRLGASERPFPYLATWLQPFAGLAVGIPFLFLLLALGNDFRTGLDSSG